MTKQIEITEMDALLVLNAVAGCQSIRKWLNVFGSAKKILEVVCSGNESTEIISLKHSNKIKNFPIEKFLQIEHQLMAKNDVRLISYQCAEYPEALKEIYDPPVLLYVKGDLPNNIAMSVAVVGSRRASIYGLNNAGKFSERFAEAGLIVISGMARGIDAAAHLGALKSKGQTIAVLGCGINIVYPPEHKSLMEKISQSGCIISEFPMTTAPLPYNFPKRNRIVSGLSLGVVVIEAAQKSGALITADFALDQGKEVYALPGLVNNPVSYGVNNLIKQGAKLVMHIDDVLEDLYPQLVKNLENSNLKAESTVKSAEETITLETKSDSKEIYDELFSQTPIHFDEFLMKTQMNISEAHSLIMQLICDYKIQQLPGNYFIINDAVLV